MQNRTKTGFGRPVAARPPARLVSVTRSCQCGTCVSKPSARTFGSSATWASGSPWTRKTLRGSRLARRLAVAEPAEPVEQLALVGVRREAGDRAHLAMDLPRLAVETDGLRTGLQVRPERPLALVADEQDRRVRVVDEVRRWPTTRPPVSIPFDATIMYGRGANLIAWDSFGRFVTICAG